MMNKRGKAMYRRELPWIFIHISEKQKNLSGIWGEFTFAEIQDFLVEPNYCVFKRKAERKFDITIYLQKLNKQLNLPLILNKENCLFILEEHFSEERIILEFDELPLDLYSIQERCHIDMRQEQALGEISEKTSGFITELNSLELGEENSNTKEDQLDKESSDLYFLLDTNAYLVEPDIVKMVGHMFNIIVPMTVLEELDRKQHGIGIDGTDREKARIKENARIANQMLLRFKNSGSVFVANSDPEILSEDFSKRNPDNRILSVAIKYKDKKLVMVSNDNNLQLKADGYESLICVTLEELLIQLKSKYITNIFEEDMLSIELLAAKKKVNISRVKELLNHRGLNFKGLKSSTRIPASLAQEIIGNN